MAVVILALGLWAGGMANSWIPFAVACIIAELFNLAKDAWLHDHIHKLYEGEEDEHGKSID